MADSSEIKIGVPGAAGRMGMMLITQVGDTDGFCLAAASEISGHDAIGRDAGELAGLSALGVAVDEVPIRCSLRATQYSISRFLPPPELTRNGQHATVLR